MDMNETTAAESAGTWADVARRVLEDVPWAQPPSQVNYADERFARDVQRLRAEIGGRATGDPMTRARLIWGTAHIREPQDVICIGPIGSRSDWLLCWRRGKRVSTGMLDDDRPCFEGSLEEFAARVEAEYGARLDEVLQQASSEYRARLRKVGDDYRFAITFLTHLLAAEVSR